ncbi:MAG TPA: CopG family transcriptional regulator, partial [Terriglobales bacterium]|nr:CopG family transcriptional regulator [Terriglobales bacterium]
MASTIIRTTYALDAETVARLDVLAREWKLSRSAALRKIIREREPEEASGPDPRLAALKRLQASTRRLTPAAIRKWQRDMRAERITQTERIEKRWQQA